MPGCNGIEVIARAKQLSPDTEAIVLTGKSSLETAVAALATARSITSPSRASWPISNRCWAAWPKNAN